MSTTYAAAIAVIARAGITLGAPGYVQKREVSRGGEVISTAPAGTLGRWQRGTMALVEESWRRRERTPFGDRYATRSQHMLLIEEPRRLGNGGSAGIVHRHPVPRTVATVGEAVAWMLRVDVAALAAVARVQGDVYVLRGTRLRSDALPAGHVEADGWLRHPAHLRVRAAGVGEVYRICRRAAECRHGIGGTVD